MRNLHKSLFGDQKRINHMGDQDVDERIRLKDSLKIEDIVYRIHVTQN